MHLAASAGKIIRCCNCIQFFKNTIIDIKYLSGKFKNDDGIDVVTAQLAIEF